MQQVLNNSNINSDSKQDKKDKKPELLACQSCDWQSRKFHLSKFYSGM